MRYRHRQITDLTVRVRREINTVEITIYHASRRGPSWQPKAYTYPWPGEQFPPALVRLFRVARQLPGTFHETPYNGLAWERYDESLSAYTGKEKRLCKT
jgi:hypothetical protein